MRAKDWSFCNNAMHGLWFFMFMGFNSFDLNARREANVFSFRNIGFCFEVCLKVSIEKNSKCTALLVNRNFQFERIPHESGLLIIPFQVSLGLPRTTDTRVENYNVVWSGIKMKQYVLQYVFVLTICWWTIFHKIDWNASGNKNSCKIDSRQPLNRLALL